MQPTDVMECQLCGETLPITSFQMSRKSPGSSHRMCVCRDCTNARSRAYYHRRKLEDPEWYAAKIERDRDRKRAAGGAY